MFTNIVRDSDVLLYCLSVIKLGKNNKFSCPYWFQLQGKLLGYNLLCINHFNHKNVKTHTSNKFYHYARKAMNLFTF